MRARIRSKYLKFLILAGMVLLSCGSPARANLISCLVAQLRNLPPPLRSVPDQEVADRFGTAKAAQFGRSDIKVLIWNIFKGQRKAWADEAAPLMEGSDLTLFQEILTHPEESKTIAAHSQQEWWVARSYRDSTDNHTGVATGSTVSAIDSGYIRSGVNEPIANTPKMALFTKYRVEGVENPLLVVNVHSLNFKGRKDYASQLKDLDGVLSQHQGPILFAGDFNTWLPNRLKSLMSVVTKNGLSEVELTGQKGSIQLDRAFIRGIRIRSARVVADSKGSDHLPIQLVIGFDEGRLPHPYDPPKAPDPLAPYASTHFAPFIVAEGAREPAPSWNEVLEAIAAKNPEKLSDAYKRIPPDEDDRAARLLVAASDGGFDLPADLYPMEQRARQQRDSLRARDITVQTPFLNKTDLRDLNNMLTLLGIRRSMAERMFQHAKGKLGFKSYEFVPIIRSGKALNALGDEARFLLDNYNQMVAKNSSSFREGYESLMDSLYRLYSKRIYQTIDEPYYNVDGKQLNLLDFVNSGFYRQQVLNPSNKWVTVGSLHPDSVKNPQLHAMGITREIWWNRDQGIHANGSTRISRNMRISSDGQEELYSVEVLYQGKDGIYVPYTFKPNSEGKLELVSGKRERTDVLSCFGCHLRLKAIIGGGITIPNYKPSPNWYINWIDRTMYKFHGSFQELEKK